MNNWNKERLDFYLVYSRMLAISLAWRIRVETKSQAWKTSSHGVMRHQWNKTMWKIIKKLDIRSGKWILSIYQRCTITIESLSRLMRKVFICLISWTSKVKKDGNRKFMRWLLKMNLKMWSVQLISSYSVVRRKNGGIEF